MIDVRARALSLCTAVVITLGLAVTATPAYALASAPATEIPASAADATIRPAAAAPTTSGCNYATTGTGTYADTLCWLDFSQASGAPLTTEYSRAGAPGNYTYTSLLGAAYGQTADSTSITTSNGRFYGAVTGYPITVTLAGGYTLTAKLTITGTGSDAAGRAVAAHTFPTWTDAFLGNGGFYTGVGGNPALYQASQGGRSTITLSDIALLDGQTRSNRFSVVVADAETTDSGESISWSRTGGTNFSWLPNTAGATDKTGTMGNACPQSFSPLIGQTSETATCAANSSSRKTGTAMLQVSPAGAGQAFSVTANLVGSGLQGVAFGVIIARAQATVQVADRIVGADGSSLDATDFAVSMTDATDVSTGSTATSATNGGISLLVDSGGTPITYGSRAIGSLASSYTASWQCFKTNPNNASRIWWPSATTSSATPPTPAQFATVTAGQFLHCTVTYTPPYVTLVKTVVNGTTGATNGASDWTLSASGTSSLASVGGEGRKTAVAPGDYALAEQARSGIWKYGYDWTGLACTASAASTQGWSMTPTVGQNIPGTRNPTIAGGTLKIVAGSDVTCTYTNTARAATTLTLVNTVTFGGASPDAWTLSATGRAVALAGPSGKTGAPSATGIQVTPAVGYQLASTGGPVQYVGTGWSCVDQNRAPLSIASDGTVTLKIGDQAVCSVSYATAKLTLLKNVPDASTGFAAPQWTITATPAALAGLGAVSAVGAETASATNTFEVLPGHGYTLSEALTDASSNLAYRQVALQQLVDGKWLDVNSANITAPATGQSATYRFVNTHLPTIALPLTGGASTDAFLIVGGAALLLALAFAVWAHRRRRRAA